jgi:protein-L-isoaspartate(D-aspartate) O-methyltransferase
MDIAQARFNMVEQQVRPWEVLHQDILDLMLELPREIFVNPLYKNLAYVDAALPLSYGETMLMPKLVGRLLQNLSLKSNETVLEVGTGSGYLTALLAKSAKQVCSLDRIAEFSQQAAVRLQQLNISNVMFETADIFKQLPSPQSYDVIVLTGSVETLSRELEEALKIGGRLFAVIGCLPVMQAILLTRVTETQWASEYLFETDIPSLVGMPSSNSFVF